MEKWLVLFIAVFAMSLHAHAGEVSQIGKLTLEYEVGQQGAPVVIIAPGRSYHRKRPLIKQLVNEFSQLGYSVLSFDWSYYPDGQPDQNLQSEFSDLETVINFVKAQPELEASTRILIGKSMGSVVAYNRFVATNDFSKLVLLSPVCAKKVTASGQKLNFAIPAFDDFYPGLLATQRPILLGVPNADYLCQTDMAYKFLSRASGNIDIQVFPGNHSFIHPKSNRNASAAVAAAVKSWVDLY